jgi:DNA-binding CsgD family transcriptional regulator
MLLPDSACALYERLYKQGGQPLDELVAPDDLDALDELRKAGLVWESAAEPVLVQAISPMVALERLAAGWRLVLDELHEKTAALSSWLRGLEVPLRGRAVGENEPNGVSLHTDAAEISALQGDLVVGASSACRRLEARQSDGTASWPEILPPPRIASTRIRHQTICTPESFADPANQKLIRQAVEAGVEYRVLPGTTTGLLISDAVALVPLAPGDDGGQAALLVRDPALVALLADYFDRLWTCAAELGDEGQEVRPQRLEILRLSATGLKDVAIARALGLSARSVRRHMDALERRTGAPSRLALGVEAARRGWL